MIFLSILSRCHNKNISIRELEAACGIGNGTIYKWKSSSPSVDKLKAVADYFGCTIDELLKED